MSGPALSAAQRAVIDHRGCDLQIIACAGAGKTEAVSRRVAALLAEGFAPEGIIAFTLTEKAGAELKERIYRRTEELLGRSFLDRLGPMHVGTIHGWCFRVLQDRVPRFGNYEVIDEHRHAALLSRKAKALDLKAIGEGKHWNGIHAWTRIVDIIGNELMSEADLEAAGIQGRFRAYEELLDRYHVLTFSRIIAETVRALENPTLAPPIREPLRHLIVDEYQDINPAQERLIELIARDPVELCVVGDDDQAIYQWRGSDIGNIVGFASRRNDVRLIRLLENRRSRPKIVSEASSFASRIPGRLEKAMEPVREEADQALCLWNAPSDIAEATIVAETIERLHASGRRYRDMAVLLRSVRGAGAPFVDALTQRGIPVAAGGRTGLFLVPELAAIGECFAFLAGFQWRDGLYGPPREPDLETATAPLAARFHNRTVTDIAAFVRDWKSFYEKLNTKPIDLIGDYYRFLNWLGLPGDLNPDRAADSALLGSLARFSTIIADYEYMTKRGRYEDDNGTRALRPGLDRGKSFWFGFGNYLLHYAFANYDDFEGEDRLGADAVQVLTVHQAKGLEWPIVFLPSLVDGRFPSSHSGRGENWIFPESVFPQEKRERYAGTDADERRLFYTAMTRARDMLYCSAFDRKKNQFSPSPYLLELAGGEKIAARERLPIPTFQSGASVSYAEPVELSFSDIATWEDCGYRYRLANSFGFENQLAVELGYGHAVHHVLRQLAEATRGSGVPGGTVVPLDRAELSSLVQSEFYAPFATDASHQRMQAAARRLVERYLDEWQDDLRHIWATERPFELHTDDGLVAGRADIILDEEGGVKGMLTIVDYKVSASDDLAPRYEWQLQVYSHAARGEGLEVSAAWLHDLGAGDRDSVEIAPPAIEAAVVRAGAALAAIRAGRFEARAEAKRCTACDYRAVCGMRHPAAREYHGECDD